MKIALFSDIHANLEALEAVLADAEAEECDSYICLGDIVGYNADPSACLERVRALDCPVIKGNHDQDGSSDASLDMMNPNAAEALYWTREQLSPEQREWLARLRLVRQIHDFTVVHATLDQPGLMELCHQQIRCHGQLLLPGDPRLLLRAHSRASHLCAQQQGARDSG